MQAGAPPAPVATRTHFGPPAALNDLPTGRAGFLDERLGSPGRARKLLPTVIAALADHGRHFLSAGGLSTQGTDKFAQALAITRLSTSKLRRWPRISTRPGPRVLLASTRC